MGARDDAIPTPTHLPRRRPRGCLLGISGFLGLCIALLALALFILDRTSATPIIPPYPNVEGRASYPSRWGIELFNEDFSGFRTTDTHPQVLHYYRERLAQEGWDGWWYRAKDGHSKTPLIIKNDSRAGGIPPGVTRIALKVRPIFTSGMQPLQRIGVHGVACSQ